MVIYKYSFNFIKGHIIKTKYKNAFKHKSNGKRYVVIGRETIPMERIDVVPEQINRSVYMTEECDDLIYNHYLSYIENERNKAQRKFMHLERVYTTLDMFKNIPLPVVEIPKS